MRSRNLSEGVFYFPTEASEIEVGAVYEITGGYAVKVTGAISEDVFGVAMGGNNMRPGFVMLNIDPTTVYKEAYSDSAPEIGAITASHKLVITVDEAEGTFEYLVVKA